MIVWQYVKTGSCEYCQDDDARLWTPKFTTPLRIVVPPLFCDICRKRLETLVAEQRNLDPTRAIELLTRS